MVLERRLDKSRDIIFDLIFRRKDVVHVGLY